MKLLKVAVAALVMAAMVTPVIAEDRLSLNGEMRVRGWHVDSDPDWNDDDDTLTWGDQRLRIGGKIAVAEGVSITFRTDITESNWGSGNTFGSGRTGVQQWDRAHLDLVSGNFHLRAGQQYVAYGMTYAVDEQSNGLAMDYYFGDTPLNVFVLLDDDNGGKDQTDAFLFGAKIAPKFGDVAFDFFVAGRDDGEEENVMLVGADMKADFGGVKLAAEIDYFDGDADDAAGVDAYGTQAMVDASLAASDAFTVGGQIFYALGDDEDQQYTSIGNGFGGWDPIADVGTSLSNEQITFGSPFNVASITAYEEPTVGLTSAGSIGGRLYTSFKAGEDLTFGASAGYFVSEEDKIADVEVMALAGGLVYKIMENTSLQLQLQYADGTLNETAATRSLGLDGDQDFDNFSAGTGLFVKF